MAALGAALLGMVAGYTDEPEARQAATRLAAVRGRATQAAEDDGVRSAAFGAALAMEDGAERERAVREATVEAIDSSLAIGRIAESLVAELRLLADIGNPHVEADLLVAAEALRAALEGSVVTARANLQLLDRHRKADDGLDEKVAGCERAAGQTARAADEVGRILAERRRAPGAR
jgi:formiminotetrahydrofolate cyclodeaminase